MKFEDNPAKSLANKSKHGLDFEEAKALWDDENLLVFPLRFEDEPRQACIGRLGGKHWTAIMTCRGTTVRIISVRRSRKEEIRAYESE
ncbi:BrnT family toxin [Desulfovibrio sp. PG-178-WT-4]|uniref:BrnT family toxin n=1 Tax=Desulfovibrio porci TaxID=2605782 RepID=A0A6L5XK91_9BACT|nr:BrnT family toxin [Desulfovibrio porci]MSS27575.1 BrnT family toxin [Desulfovibrio porci]